MAPPTSRFPTSRTLKVLDYNMDLTGNGAEVRIYVDGEESTSDRRGADPSIRGNQLSGTFTLTIRGWETEVRNMNMPSRYYMCSADALCCGYLLRGIVQVLSHHRQDP